MSAWPVAWRLTSPHLQMPWYGWICEQAETFCRKTWTGFEHLMHLKVSVRAGFIVFPRRFNSGRAAEGAILSLPQGRVSAAITRATAPDILVALFISKNL